MADRMSEAEESEFENPGGLLPLNAAAEVQGQPPPRLLRQLPRRAPEAAQIPLFRNYVLGLAPLSLGSWMQLVALGYLTLQVTGSAAAVGLVGAADGIPAVLLSLPAGAAGDRFSRRAVLIAASSAMGLTALGLGVAAALGRASLPVLIGAAICFGAADAFDAPTRQALVADIVPSRQLVGAAALTGTVSSVTRIIGPAMGGVLLAAVGPASCFLAMAVSVIPFLVVLVVSRWPVVPAATAGLGAVRRMVDGLRWSQRDAAARTVLIGSLVLGVLGIGYMPYLPVFNRELLHGGGQVLGLMYSVGGIGAMVGGVGLSLMSRHLRQDRLLLASAPLYALSLFGLTRATSLTLALPCLAGISLGFLGASTAMLTVLQARAPGEMRARVLSLYTLSFAGGGPLGTLLYAGATRIMPLFTAIAVGAVVVGITLLWSGSCAALRALT
jgi:MFS family permease